MRGGRLTSNTDPKSTSLIPAFSPPSHKAVKKVMNELTGGFMCSILLKYVKNHENGGFHEQHPVDAREKASDGPAA